MSNAVIYARYSSGHQREESIEGQIRECTNFAKRNGLTIVEHYIDRAISAKTDDRPSFQQMVADSSKKTAMPEIALASSVKYRPIRARFTPPNRLYS